MRLVTAGRAGAEARAETRRRWAAWPVVLAALAVGASLVGRLWPFAFSNDEGTYLMWARLARQGYRLYSEVWCDQPPLIPWALMAAFSVFPESVVVGRTLAVGVTTLGVLAVGLIAQRAAGRWAGVATVVGLGVSPIVAWYGRAVMSDVPANALAALGILAALAAGDRAARGEDRPALVGAGGAGLLFGASLMVKLVTLPLAPVALLALAPSVGRTGGARAAAWAGGVGLAAAASLAPVDVTAAVGQILGTVAAARGAEAWTAAATGARFAEFGRTHAVLLGPALVGIAAALRRRERAQVTLVVWLVLAGAALAAHSPLYEHHLALAVFPLAALAGVGAAGLGSGGAWRAAAGVGLALSVIALPGAVAEARVDATDRESDNWAMLEGLRAAAPEGAWIISDNAVLAFRAGLRLPPYLADTGGKRFTPELLPDRDWVRETARWRPEAILFTRSGQANVGAYLDWVNHTYGLTQRYSERRRLWTPTPPGPVIELAAQGLDAEVTLEGYSLARATVAPGGEVRLGLFWAATGPLAQDYHVFAHLVAADGRLVAQDDGPPARGAAPTSGWRAERWVLDLRTLKLPADLAPGEYAIEVGLYRLGGERLGAGLRLPTRVSVGR